MFFSAVLRRFAVLVQIFFGLRMLRCLDRYFGLFDDGALAEGGALRLVRERRLKNLRCKILRKHARASAA